MTARSHGPMCHVALTHTHYYSQFHFSSHNFSIEKKHIKVAQDNNHIVNTNTPTYLHTLPQQLTKNFDDDQALLVASVT